MVRVSISLRKVYSDTTALLRAHPVALGFPAMAVTLAQLFGVTPGDQERMALTFGILYMLQLAVTGGWLASIGKAVGGAAPAGDDFLEGVGRFFFPLLLGSLAFWAPVLGLGLAASTWAGRITPGQLLHLSGLLQHQDPAAFTDPAWITLARWGLFALAIAFVAFFLTLWKQGVAVGRKRWFFAWGESVRLTLRNWWPLSLLATVQGLCLLVFAAISAVGTPGLLLGLMGMLGCQIYFTVAFTRFYVEARGGLPTEPAPEVPQETASR